MKLTKVDNQKCKKGIIQQLQGAERAERKELVR